MNKEEVMFHALRLTEQERNDVANACLAENKLSDILKAMRAVHVSMGEFLVEIVLTKAAFEAVKRRAVRQNDVLGSDVWNDNESIRLRGNTIIRGE